MPEAVPRASTCTNLQPVSPSPDGPTKNEADLETVLCMPWTAHIACEFPKVWPAVTKNLAAVDLVLTVDPLLTKPSSSRRKPFFNSF
jgi:hypothetical protein